MVGLRLFYDYERMEIFASTLLDPLRKGEFWQQSGSFPVQRINSKKCIRETSPKRHKNVWNKAPSSLVTQQTASSIRPHYLPLPRHLKTSNQCPLDGQQDQTSLSLNYKSNMCGNIFIHKEKTITK